MTKEFEVMPNENCFNEMEVVIQGKYVKRWSWLDFDTLTARKAIADRT